MGIEWIVGLLTAIPILGPLLLKAIEVIIKLLDKFLDSWPAKAVGTMVIKTWQFCLDALKWIFSPIKKLIISPLDRLYTRLFRIMDIAIDLLEKEFILIGKILEKKVDDYINKDFPEDDRVVHVTSSKLLLQFKVFRSASKTFDDFAKKRFSRKN